MEKQIYYVTVDVGPHTGQIRDQIDLNDPNYDFEIEATDEEIHQLEELFERIQETDVSTFVKAHIPYETQERMQKSRQEDHQITEIYQMIYRLATKQTRQQMKASNMVFGE